MRRALIVVASVSLVGCKGEPAPRRAPADDAAPAVTQGPATRVVDSEPLPASPRPVLPRRTREELLEAGKGARRVLRYALAPAAQTLVARAQIQSHAFDGGWIDPVTLAPVREGFEVTPTAGGPVQLRGLIAELDRAGQPEAAIAAAEGYLTRWRALLERRRADLAFDARGGLGEVTFQTDPGGAADPDARDELLQRWLGLVVPLPEQPVGVGARWKVVTLLRSGGATMTQTAIYRLAAVARDRWTIEVDLTRLGRPQAITLPGLPAGTSAELIALVRKVQGTVVVSPASPLPLEGELTADVRSHARFTATGLPPRDQYSEDTATITLGPAPAAPTAPTPPAP